MGCTDYQSNDDDPYKNNYPDSVDNEEENDEKFKDFEEI